MADNSAETEAVPVGDANKEAPAIENNEGSDDVAAEKPSGESDVPTEVVSENPDPKPDKSESAEQEHEQQEQPVLSEEKPPEEQPVVSEEKPPEAEKEVESNVEDKAEPDIKTAEPEEKHDDAPAKPEEVVETTGVVFSFNKEGILFEFETETEDNVVGVALPKDLVVDTEGTKMPEDVLESGDGMEKYVGYGDELKISLTKVKEVREFFYEEDEEEVGEDGQVTYNCKKVEVKPEWIAIKAAISRKAELENGDDDQEEMETDANGQDEDQPEEEEEEDVLLLNADDKIDDIESVESFSIRKTIDNDDSKKSEQKEQQQVTDLRSKISPKKKESPPKKHEPKYGKDGKKLFHATIPKVLEIVTLDDDTPKPTAISAKRTEISESTPPPGTGDAEPEILFSHKARVLQLRKPTHATKFDDVKVTSCVIEMLEGRYAGKTVSTSNNFMYMWGHSLNRASLNLVIKYGDPCQVEYKVIEKFDDEDEEAEAKELLAVKRVYFGPQVEKHIRPVDDPKFAVYLANRGIDDSGFLRWITNQAPAKPFFPFVSDVYEGEVLSFIRDPTTNLVNALYLTNLQKVFRPSKDGGLISVKQAGGDIKPLAKTEAKKTSPTKHMFDEPAPPGDETKTEDVPEVMDVSTSKAKNLPGNKSEWTALNYLQWFCSQKKKFVVDVNAKEVKFGDDVKFPFSKVTNFQADTREFQNMPGWKDSGPFYTIGTLAFFMENRYLKYSAYVARVTSLDHDQFVKRKDIRALVSFLVGSEEAAPPNVRPMSEVNEDEVQDKSIFKDRYVVDDDNDPELDLPDDETIGAVLVMAEDFFVGGVKLGRCDVRVIVRAGDKVKCQIQLMSNAEKRRYKKILSARSDLKVEHLASLAYVGDKRPKAVNITPSMAPDLQPILNEHGWSIEDFEYMRYYGLSPNQGQPVGGGAPMGMMAGPPPAVGSGGAADASMDPAFAKRELIKSLALRSMDMTSETDPRIEELIQSKEEISIASFMSKVLTEALVKKMQMNLRSKLHEFVVTPKFQKDLESQAQKLAAACTSLSKTATATPSTSAPTASASKTSSTSVTKFGTTPAGKKFNPTVVRATVYDDDKSKNKDSGLANIADKLKEVESNLSKEYARQQSQIKSAATASKIKAPTRNVRKMLTSYKNEKNKEKEVKAMVDVPSNPSDWKDVDYLRHYIVNKKKITVDSSSLWFGSIGFQRQNLTNFRTNKDKRTCYKLETLYYCHLFRNLTHNRYIEKVKGEGCKEYVDYRDKDQLLQYLDGGPKPKNMKPEFDSGGNKRRSEERAGSSGTTDRKKSKVDEAELKARLQMHMLEQQKKHQQEQILHDMRQAQLVGLGYRPEAARAALPPMAVSAVNAVIDAPAGKPKKAASRFDMPIHPSMLSQQPPPGIAIPQVAPASGLIQQAPPVYAPTPSTVQQQRSRTRSPPPTSTSQPWVQRGDPEPRYHHRERSPYRREEESRRREGSYGRGGVSPPRSSYPRSPPRGVSEGVEDLRRGLLYGERPRSRSPQHGGRSPPPGYRNYLERAYFETKRRSPEPDRRREPSRDYDPMSPTRSPPHHHPHRREESASASASASALSQRDIEDRWRQEMLRMQSDASRQQQQRGRSPEARRDLGVGGGRNPWEHQDLGRRNEPSYPTPVQGDYRRSSGDGDRRYMSEDERKLERERERVAEEQAQMELQQLMATKQRQQPDVIDLLDSDDEDDRKKNAMMGRPRGPPPPPVLSSQQVTVPRGGPATPPWGSQRAEDPWASLRSNF